MHVTGLLIGVRLSGTHTDHVKTTYRVSSDSVSSHCRA